MTDKIQNIKVNLKYLVIPWFIYEDNRLNATQMKVYGFINSFKGNKFFFSNAHMAEMFKVSENTISSAVGKLQEFGYIKAKYHIKANGGKIRYITNLMEDIVKKQSNSNPDTKKSLSRKQRSLVDNDNKINDNKVNNNNLQLASQTVVNKKKTFKKNYKDEDKAYEISQYLEEFNHLDEVLTEAIKYYWDCYSEKVGVFHPKIKVKQWLEVEDTLNEFQAEWDLNEGEWVKLIDQWFKKKEGTDFNIIHFTTGEILNNCAMNSGAY